MTDNNSEKIATVLTVIVSIISLGVAIYQAVKAFND